DQSVPGDHGPAAVRELHQHPLARLQPEVAKADRDAVGAAVELRVGDLLVGGDQGQPVRVRLGCAGGLLPDGLLPALIRVALDELRRVGNDVERLGRQRRAKLVRCSTVGPTPDSSSGPRGRPKWSQRICWWLTPSEAIASSAVLMSLGKTEQSPVYSITI